MSERGSMLEYEWGNQSAAAMFAGDDTAAAAAEGNSDQNRQFFDPYGTHHNFEAVAAGGGGHFGTVVDHQQLFHHPPPEHGGLYDPRAYGGASFAHHQVPLLSLEPAAGYAVVPKSEPLGVDFSGGGGGTNLGLNLGGPYFSAAVAVEDDFVSRLYRRSRAVEAGFFNTPRCQADGCNADLTHAKHYYRRHKVCEFHSKAATVVVAGGLTQRFCQQCSRFHVLTEFDNGKRSCRRRLADHNRRRRKNPQQNRDAQNSSSDSLARSPSDSSGAHSSSSVTVAVSPPSMECYGTRRSSPYGYVPNETATTTAATACSSSSASTSSLFFSHG